LGSSGIDARRAVTRPRLSYDVAVVGAGVVGAAIARELTGAGLECVLVEAGPDVGAGTSKANTALLHTGFDAKPGTLEAKLVARGHVLLEQYAARVGVPVARIGALLVAWSAQQLDAFPEIVARAHANRYTRIRELDVDELYAREPELGAGAHGALEIPDEGIVCPFTTPLAYATEAVRAGCALRLNTRVTGARRREGGFALETSDGELGARLLVNAAGLYADELDRMLGYERFSVTPRRGELIVFDKLARGLLRHIVLAVPTGTTKGVLVSPSVFGNVIVGPTAEDVLRKDDTSSTEAGLAYVRAEARRILPALLAHEVTAVYVGLRAATEHADYQISADDGYVCVGGIRSTGLTASLAIAEHVRELLGIRASNRVLLAPPPMPNIGELAPRPYEEGGRIVCFCERVTLEEIERAFASTIPPVDMDGLRRRTRVLMGRCQGFYCGARVRALLEAR
jgi:glycerol-3-phosphate dehydrogenase